MSKAKQKLIYLAAASHSGSTMTAMLLSAHPDLCSVGELKAIHLGDKDSYLCSCNTKVSDCEFWQGVKTHMSKRGQEFDIHNAKMDIRTEATPYVKRLLRPLVREPAVELVRDALLNLSSNWRVNKKWLQQRNRDYIAAIAEQSGVNAIVDSSKIGIRLKYLLQDDQLDVRIIWVVRDGRGVSLAYKKPSEFADAKDPKLRGGGAGKTQEQGRNIAVGAKEWVRCNQETQALLKTLPKEQWMKVHYEDICTNTNETLDKVFNFLGVDPTKKRLDFKSVEHHVLGNGMRLDASDEIKLDDRWREELTAEELATFNSVAGVLHRQLGYGDS